MIKFTENKNDLIKQQHFLDYEDYCEIKLMTEPDEDGICYRCNTPLDPLTLYMPEFCYQPCWSCISRRKLNREILTTGLLKSMHDFYTRLAGDRYYQLFLVDDIYPRTTFPHTYNTFKKTISLLNPPSRNDIWFLDWLPGYPKLICQENLPGIKIVNITKLYEPIDLGKEKMKVGEYEILWPEILPFDYRHHSRYSILNNSSTSQRRQKVRRLKLGEKCIKFYNTADDNVKSLFKITKGGKDVAIRSLSYQDYVIIKLMIMRNKSFIKLIFDVIEEVSKQAGTLRETVFLKNTIELSPKKDIEVTILWSELSEYKKENNINISII